MPKTIEEQLKEIILTQYGDMKSFAIKAGMPNSTLSSMLQRGILNTTIGKVIRLSDTLQISVDGLVEGKIEPKVCTHSETESTELKELKQIYYSINEKGRALLVTQAKLIANSEEYRNVSLLPQNA